MKQKIQELINPTIDQKYQKFIERFRKDHVPEKYNQIELLNELNNPEIDHYISLSNRTDGKSFNYIHALLNIAIEFDIGLSFFSRNMMLRVSYQTLIDDIIEKSTILNRKDFNFIRQQYYVSLNYRDKTIAIISDLNNATELKYFSNFLKNFPIMIYDEFLALESDYLPDEWDRLKTIYESIDRIEDRPLIHKPKIIYLGNTVNFSSPILAGLKIFNILEQHEINTAKIYHYDFNVMLEMRRNENANQRRNTRAFSSANDNMTTAQFKTNNYNIATKSDHLNVMKNPRKIYVKLENQFLLISFNRDNFTIILNIVNFTDEEYQYNLLLKDNKATSIYLNENYFSDKQIRKIDKGAYLFENNFSKEYITSEYSQINRLKIDKIVKEFLKDENEYSEGNAKEEQFKENYIQQTKRNLMAKMWS